MQDCSGIMETLVATLQALKQLRRLCLQRCDLDDVIGTAVVSDGLGAALLLCEMHAYSLSSRHVQAYCTTAVYLCTS